MFLELDRDLEVIGEATNGAEAVRAAHVLHRDMILIDLLMLSGDGQHHGDRHDPP